MTSTPSTGSGLSEDDQVLRKMVQAEGVTLIELLATLAILAVLAAGIMPLSRMTYWRAKELELRQNLRVIRKALDKYKELSDKQIVEIPAFSSGYPKTLEILVEGVESTAGPNPVRIKLLRRIPKDPMTSDGEWGLRSYSDEPDSEIWGEQDVYDVYSKSERQALDGSYYRDW